MSARVHSTRREAVFDGKVTGLLLTPTNNGRKWTLRFTSPLTGKRRDPGFGTYPETSIVSARKLKRPITVPICWDSEGH
ncbi:integrase arm-type DNA-binding domain-containing protein [Paraburkholderia fungorum]|uniref:integrase arm-type DNA-binding domain-containing protein n=1 Tax=Paraburkholderia fungorum TaxID=134537 RepID=UPI0038B9D4DB